MHYPQEEASSQISPFCHPGADSCLAHTGQLAAGTQEQRAKNKTGEKPSKTWAHEEIDGGDQMERSGNDNNYPGRLARSLAGFPICVDYWDLFIH